MNTTDENISALEAQFRAQQIAFAPMVFQAAKALRDLGILNLLFDNRQQDGLSIEEVTEELTLSVYAVKLLLEIGVSMGLVSLTDDKYTLSKIGYFVAKDEVTRVNMNFTHDVCYQGLFYLQEALKTGKPAGLQVFGKWDTVYEALSSLPEQVQRSWFEFDHFYSDVAFPIVLKYVFTQQPKVILDVGGNTGKWAIACAQHNADVVIKILDHPGQLEKAKAKVAEQGFSNRVMLIPGNVLDATQAFPAGADVIWMSQFLDCFSAEQIVNILRKAKAAMQAGSSLFILETYWDRQRFPASTYSLQSTSLYFACMANGNSKMYRSTDMLQYVEEAGLRVVEEVDNIGMGHTLFRCCLYTPAT